ncbi:MAG: hypothetical protein M9921_07480 [Fimbriimonadaceae bacterium]|nr:hypothetical protein [Fimbriimonadaceae bacterium]
MAVLGAPLIIDGSHGEGGGALVRTALAMAALTQQPVRIVNVRGGTGAPGLNPEDLTVLRAVAWCSGAEVLGADPGSNSVSFLPTRRPRGMNELLDISEGQDGPGFANALVVLNSLLPLLARTGSYSSLSAQGETYASRVLSYDYFANVTLRAARSFGLYAVPDLPFAGFGRGSRGEVRLEVEPSALTGVDWQTRGALVGVRALVTTGELPEQVAARGLQHLGRLAFYAGFEVEADANLVPSKGPGAMVTVWGEFERGLGGCAVMGQRGVRIEAVAQQAFEGFAQWMRTDATVDEYLADQILILAAMAEGQTRFRTPNLTPRFLTSAWVIKQFLPIHITIRGAEGEPGDVTIRR